MRGDLPSSTEPAVEKRSRSRACSSARKSEREKPDDLSSSVVDEVDIQKYPSRFLSSMEPSWSWSMMRFARSDERKESNSAMILGRVSASERMAPVQGLQPSERSRERTM